jgi:hypothetical protein
LIVIARSEATKQSSSARSAPNKSAAAAANSVFYWRACRRALDCFAIGERSDAVLSNGYGSQ